MVSYKVFDPIVHSLTRTSFFRFHAVLGSKETGYETELAYAMHPALAEDVVEIHNVYALL